MLPDQIVQWLDRAIVPAFDGGRFSAAVAAIPEKVLWSGRAFRDASHAGLVENGVLKALMALAIAVAAALLYRRALARPDGILGSEPARRAALAPVVLAIACLASGFGNILEARDEATLGYALTGDRVLVVPGAGEARSIPLKALSRARLQTDGRIVVWGRSDLSLTFAQPPGGDADLRAAVERVVALGVSQAGRLSGPGIEPAPGGSDRTWRFTLKAMGFVLSIAGIMGAIAMSGHYPRLGYLVGSLSVYPFAVMTLDAPAGVGLSLAAYVSIVALLFCSIFMSSHAAAHRAANGAAG